MGLAVIPAITDFFNASSLSILFIGAFYFA